jgi:hypothetical protein
MSLIHYGDLFRLRWVSRKRGIAPLYLISAEKGGREYYPRMGSIAEAVLLMLAAAHDRPQDRLGQPVSDRALVQLQTTESVVGAANTIGAWRSDHYLYYHPPGRPEQDWQIDVNARVPGDGRLHAGQLLLIISRQSSELRMARDTREPDYLSLDAAAHGSWQIELGPFPPAPASPSQ